MQEAQGKWPAFRERFDGIELHLIGPLQSNKTRAAMELFDVIHTVDRVPNWPGGSPASPTRLANVPIVSSR